MMMSNVSKFIKMSFILLIINWANGRIIFCYSLILKTLNHLRRNVVPFVILKYSHSYNRRTRSALEKLFILPCYRRHVQEYKNYLKIFFSHLTIYFCRDKQQCYNIVVVSNCIVCLNHVPTLIYQQLYMSLDAKLKQVLG